MKKQKTRVKIVDKYEKYADIGAMYSSKWKKLNLFIPSNFRMLCAILGVRPEKILINFMWLVSYSVLKDATDEQRRAARKFFILGGYGQSLYSKHQINQMFNELRAVRKIYDTTDRMDQNNRELFWKSNHMYTEYWFKRWFEMNRRKGDVTILNEY